MNRLGADLGLIEGMVLSHGHWDHAGAMPRALDLITQRNGGQAVPTYMHPGMFRTRATKGPDGKMRPLEDVPSIELLNGRGADVISTSEPQSVLDRMFYVSGEIRGALRSKRGCPASFGARSMDQGGRDPLLMDERFVAVNVRDKGIVVFTACSHVAS